MIKLSAAGGESVGGGELEFVTGTEFDTGDTLDGDIIYEKYIDFGTMPNTGTKNVAHGISNLGVILRSQLSTDNGVNQVSWDYDPSAIVHVFFSDTNITAISTNNQSTHNGLMWMRYVKV